MASKPRKPAKGRAVQSRAQARTAAGPEVVPSKDAKPTFGKAAPKKVVPGVMPKVAAKTAKPRQPAAAGGSKAGAAMRAVVSFAASVIGRGGSKAKAK